MTLAQVQYAELIALTKEFLKQNFLPTDRLPTDPETYHHFRNHAIASQNKKGAAQGHQPPKAPLPHKTAAPISQSQPGPQPLPATPITQTANAHTRKPQPRRTPLPTPQLANTPSPTDAKLSESSKEEQGVSPKFRLDITAPPEPENFAEIRRVIREKLPNMQIVDSVPDDAQARLLARGWEQKRATPEIMILTFNEPPRELAFLQNVARALNVYGIRCDVVNASSIDFGTPWEQILQAGDLKLVIGNGASIEKIPGLKGIRSVKLADTSTYLREPIQKALLWQTILQSRG